MQRNIDNALDVTFGRLSDQNYAESFNFYRLWFDIGHAYHQIPSDRIFDTIWSYRVVNSKIDLLRGQLIHSAESILRFARDAESDHILAPHSFRLQSRLSTSALQEFFGYNMCAARGDGHQALEFYTATNFVAHWANLGYVDENVIHSRILQSLISHPKLHDHQAYALIILFKLAGATFEAYVDPSVVDRCFELLKGHCTYDPVHCEYDPGKENLERTKQVCAPLAMKYCRRAKTDI